MRRTPARAAYPRPLSAALVPVTSRAALQRQAAPDFSKEELEYVGRLLRHVPSEDNLIYLPAHSILEQARSRPQVVRPLINTPALAEAIRDRTRTSPWQRAVAVWLLTRARILPEHGPVAALTLCEMLEPHTMERRSATTLRDALRVLPWSLLAASIAYLVSVPGLLRIGGPGDTVRHLLHLSGGDGSLDWLPVVAIPAAVFLLTTVILTALRSAAGVPAAVAMDIQARVAAAEALGQIRLPGSVPALTGAAFAISVRVREAAAAALMNVLPALTTEHYAGLPAAAVPALCRLLGHPDETLAVEALHTLGRVGDARALPPVERLATRGRTAAIQLAAFEALPTLRARQRQQRDPQMLLRPAAAPLQTERPVSHPNAQPRRSRPSPRTGQPTAG